ncbi:MAG: efflux RND transporter permease subunit, partial [Anaerolineae bacterium]
VDRFPAIDIPFVSVISVFPGASPSDVEDLVIKPIEDAVAGIPGVDFVQSVSNESFGFVVIAFLEGVDGNRAAIDVERQVATIKGSLPDDATDPAVLKADFNAIPIMNIILSGPQSQDELFKLAEDVVKPRLQSARGVASVSVAGGRDRVIAVKLDAKKLAAYSLPVSAINQTFALNNLTFPIGSLEEGRLKSSLRSVGSFQSLAEIEDMVVAGGPSPFGGMGGRPPLPGSDTGGLIFLKDVATVEDTFKDTTVYQRFNGQDTVALSIIKTSDANVIEVADTINKRIEALNQNLPGGAKITVVGDDSKFVRNSVGAVEEDLILAVLVTGLVMLLFLHTVRSTFIVLMAIPTSLFATFLVMWALGYSLNVLTLLALTLIIGILVDDSIVVLENIERHLKMKKKPDRAAIDGRREIGLAAIAITLTDVVVYVPVAFTSGIVGQFFRSYGITITVATLFSLFVSFTLTPLLAAYWMKDESADEADEPRRGLAGLLGKLLAPIDWLWNRFVHLWERGFVGLSNIYARTLRLSLKNVFTQLMVVVIAVAALAGSLALAPAIGFEFMP